MKLLQRILVTLTIAALLSQVGRALAQTATVDLGNQKQSIRGFGGMNHPAWIVGAGSGISLGLALVGLLGLIAGRRRRTSPYETARIRRT